jgi:RNA polymerase sigma-70 factor (ECF subfamily)
MTEPDRDEQAPASLVGRIRDGDRTAEAELVGRYRRAVTVVLSGSRRDPAAIDDLFQETFRIAIEKIRAGAVREPEKLAGFLSGLARNLAIEHFRKAAKHRSAGRADPEALPSADGGPLEDLLRSERAAITRRVLTELSSDRDRQVLYRFYIAEEDKAGICRELALTSIHFNRVLFRARERYRTLYLEAARRGAR